MSMRFQLSLKNALWIMLWFSLWIALIPIGKHLPSNFYPEHPRRPTLFVQCVGSILASMSIGLPIVIISTVFDRMKIGLIVWAFIFVVLLLFGAVVNSIM